MFRLMFRHISGARASELDVIALEGQGELILGSAQSAAVRFDLLEERVGRRHARISWTDETPNSFVLADLGSRSGTFLNWRLLSAPIILHSGDIIQLGAQGPEVEVRWEGAASAPLELIG